MYQSVWTDTIKMPEFETLHSDTRTDVLVIGGGLCGVLCAYFLKNAGVDYMLVEGKTIGSGITQNTTAKITSQHGLIYERLINDFGKEKAYLYLWANQEALEKYRQLSRKIKCDFQEKSAYVYSKWDRWAIEEEIRAVNSLGFPAELAENLPLPFETEGAVCFPEQAQSHPLKFLAGIARGLNIYENTFVEKIENHTAYTENSKIEAGKIIVATHFPFLNKRGSYFLKLYQHRSYVIALENAPDVQGMYLDADNTGMSFRNYGNLLLLGGGSHRTGKKGGNWRELRDSAAGFYPEAVERYYWATQDCMPLDGIPYIGHYSKHTPDLYVATGFQKWGMTSSMVSAMLLCDMILERENDWAEVFSPSRNILKPQLLVNGLEATKNLLTPSSKRCPHMGCALKWNSAEHTWDCPCHGSRFEEEGKLIDNPAKKGC